MIFFSEVFKQMDHVTVTRWDETSKQQTGRDQHQRATIAHGTLQDCHACTSIIHQDSQGQQDPQTFNESRIQYM